MDNITTTTLAPPPTRSALKAVLIMMLFFSTFLASLTAFLFKRASLHAHDSWLSMWFSLASCFGGGVFLATCLLDLLPDSIECIEKAGFKFEFPLIELCIGLEFLLVLSIEQAIVYSHESGWIGEGHERLLSHHDDGHDHPAYDHPDVPAHDHPSAPARDNDDSVSEASQIVDSHFGLQHSTIRVVLLVMALSLHAVFEGLSLGMIPEVTALLQVFAALAIHKTVIGFSLGIRLVQSSLRTFQIVICCAIFAGQVIIGGFTGLVIMDILKTRSIGTAHLVSGLLQAVACGTFLYITCFEILPHELSRKGYRPGKMLCLFLGFALIATFIGVFPED